MLYSYPPSRHACPPPATPPLRAHGVRYSPQCELLGLAPPMLLVVSGARGAGKTHAVAAAAAAAGAVLVRVSACDVLARSVGRDRLRAPLLALVESARAAAPAVLLIDDAHFLFAEDDHDAAAALAAAAEALWSTTIGGVALVVTLAPDRYVVHRKLWELADLSLEIMLVDANDAPWAVETALRITGLCDMADAVAIGNGEDSVGGCVEYGNLLYAARGSTIAELCEAARRVASAVVPGDTAWPLAQVFKHMEAALVHQTRHPGVAAVNALVTFVTNSKKLDVGCSGFENVGGADDAVRELREVVLWGTLRWRVYARLGAGVATGSVLLYGPPGTGKTLLVREAALACGAALVVVDASTLARGDVGASERILRDLYARAQAASPAIVFFDEVDALFGGGGTAGLGRLSTALALELDANRSGVVTICATNRPWRVPMGLLRAGRLERTIHVGLPSRNERAALARVYASRLALDDGETAQLQAWASSSDADGMSGADLAGACRRAALEGCVDVVAIARAFALAGPSVDATDAERVARWQPPRQCVGSVEATPALPTGRRQQKPTS
jgi:transitional endoplasmic reticulum ATPase